MYDHDCHSACWNADDWACPLSPYCWLGAPSVNNTSIGCKGLFLPMLATANVRAICNNSCVVLDRVTGFAVWQKSELRPSDCPGWTVAASSNALATSSNALVARVRNLWIHFFKKIVFASNLRSTRSRKPEMPKSQHFQKIPRKPPSCTLEWTCTPRTAERSYNDSWHSSCTCAPPKLFTDSKGQK